MSKKNHLRGLDKQIREKSPVIDKILTNFDNDDDSDFNAIESAVYGNEDSGFDVNDVDDMSATLEEYALLDDDDEDDEYEDYSDEDDELIEDIKNDDYDDEDEVDAERSRCSSRKSKKNKKKCINCDNDDCDDEDDDDEPFIDDDDVDLGYESVLKPSRKKKSGKRKYKDEDYEDGLDLDLDEDSDDPNLDYMDGAEECSFETALATVDFGEVMKAVNLFNDDDVVVQESLSVVEGIDDDFYSFIDDDDL